MEDFVSPEEITLTRQEFYEKVWSTPMQKLAKEFGLADVGLAKLCHRHEIPVPRQNPKCISNEYHVERSVTFPAPAADEFRVF
jgi:hypothetical protein